MKKIFSLMLICVIFLSVFAMPAVADSEITIMVNGEKLITDVPAQTLPVYDEAGEYVGDRVMLPVRAISEKLNADVYWDGETAGITLYRKENLYIMWVGMDTAFHLEGISLNKSYEMDVPPTIIDGRTLIPIRAVVEILGADVDWISETKTVDVRYDLGEAENNSGAAEVCNIYQQILKTACYDDYKNHAKGTLETVTGKFVLESGEEIKFELYPSLAPETCANFVTLAKEKFYDGTIFHRVIKDFVAQGGGFDKNETPKAAGPILGEFVMNGFFNLIPHKRGTISMARPDDFNAASSQFFIVQKDAPSLNGNYAAFGTITEGMEWIDKICEATTDEGDKPIHQIVLKQVIID